MVPPSVLLLLLLSVCVAAGLHPTYPERTVHRLDGTHPFVLLPDVENPHDLDPTGVEFNDYMAVPGSFDAHPRYAMHRATAVYKIQVETKPNTHQRLKFEACSLWCQVWVDGKKVGRHHSNGYTAFWRTLPPTAATRRTIHVVVDSRFDRIRTPLQNKQYDFYQYGGLTRSIYLHESTHATWIQRVDVTTKDYTTGSVELTVFLWSPPSRARASDDATTFLVSFDGTEDELPVPAEVGDNGGYALGTLHVPDFRIWEPGSPGLHTVSVRVEGGDSTTVRFGIRTVEAVGKHILLNGQQLRMLGYCYHDMAPGVGASVPASRRLADLHLLRQQGGNFLRLVHYPADPELLALCDEQGIVVWEEQIQHHPYSDWPEISSPEVASSYLEGVEEMVNNTFNHPSVIMWGFLNEGPSDEPQNRGLYEAITERFRALDPSRLLTFASSHGPYGADISSGECTDLMLDLVDVVSFNSYPGWYGAPHHPDPQLIAQIIVDQFNAEVRFVNAEHPDKPLIKSETGAGAIPGWHDPEHFDFIWTEEFQAHVVKATADYFTGRYEPKEDAPVSMWGRFSGLALWMFADTRTRTGPDQIMAGRPRQFNNKGVLTENRASKLAAGLVSEAFNAWERAHPLRDERGSRYAALLERTHVGATWANAWATAREKVAGALDRSGEKGAGELAGAAGDGEGAGEGEGLGGEDGEGSGAGAGGGGAGAGEAVGLEAERVRHRRGEIRICPPPGAGWDTSHVLAAGALGAMATWALMRRRGGGSSARAAGRGAMDARKRDEDLLRSVPSLGGFGTLHSSRDGGDVGRRHVP